MADLVSYRLDEAIAEITMDDGKVNAMSPTMQDAMGAALDRAEADQAVVLLSGREGVFCAGFDLAIIQAGGSASTAMVRGGFELAARLLSFPRPVVIACTGHAVAMGAFILLSGDYRIGSTGPYKLTANEVAIGLTMPDAATEIMRQRLTPAAFNRAITTADVFGSENAVETGFLDRVVPAAELEATARVIAVAMNSLDRKAHAESKLRARAQSLEAIRRGIESYGA